MTLASPDRVWLPLGNAQIIDWKHLEREDSPRGATAWVGMIGGESCLVRTWCEETTTHFEFSLLARASLTGRLTLRVARPEPSRLDVKLEAEIPGQLAFVETSGFSEHPRTGLQGSVRREITVRSGAFDAKSYSALTPAQAEIFEFSPESALHTDCGTWLAAILTNIRSHLLERPNGALPVSVGRSSEPEHRPEEPRRPVEPEPEPEARRAPEPDPRPPEAESRRHEENRRAPAPIKATPPARAPTPPAPAPRARRLFASTNAGDSWEIVDEETYIGRSKQCTVVLKSQRVSRKHASVTREGEGWFINDLGAANGIWAGTDKIDRELIEDGSEYIIGDVLLTFTYS